MSSPIQRPASNSNAAKRLNKVPRGEPRLFVASDGYDFYVWATDPAHPSLPQPVLREWDVDDAALWAGIVALVESGGVL